MNPLQLMELNKARFTPNDQLIYNTIISDPSRVVHMTTSVLAEACGVSQPALSRFVKSLGYRRYQDFRASLITCLSRQSDLDAQGTGHLPYFNLLYQLLAEAEKVMTPDYMQELADYICSADRIFATGMSKSYHPALLFEILARKARRHIQSVPRDVLLEVGDAMQENDLLIIFSVSAKAAIMEDAVQANGKLLLITTNPNHNYHGAVDREVLLPYVSSNPEDSSVSPILFDMFVELLITFILKNSSMP